MGKKSLAAALCAVAVAATGAGSAFAGEITGNGKSLKIDPSKWGTGLHARSACAYSGQEDLQFPPFSDPTAGHAQSWGQIPKADRDFLTSIGSNPGIACNPIKSTGAPE